MDNIPDVIRRRRWQDATEVQVQTPLASTLLVLQHPERAAPLSTPIPLDGIEAITRRDKGL
jgi:hypothetical protein